MFTRLKLNITAIQRLFKGSVSDYACDLLTTENGTLLFTQDNRGICIGPIYFNLMTQSGDFLVTQSDESIIVRY